MKAHKNPKQLILNQILQWIIEALGWTVAWNQLIIIMY